MNKYSVINLYCCLLWSKEIQLGTYFSKGFVHGFLPRTARLESASNPARRLGMGLKVSFFDSWPFSWMAQGHILTFKGSNWQFFLKRVWGRKVISVIFEALFLVLSLEILLQNCHFDPLKVRIWPLVIKEKGQESKKLTFTSILSLLIGLEADSNRVVLGRKPWTKPFWDVNK